MKGPSRFDGLVFTRSSESLLCSSGTFAGSILSALRAWLDSGQADHPEYCLSPIAPDTRSAWYLELFAEPHLLLEGLG